eukprot:12892133-Prorocentrum_lima.AAC.1
MLLLMLLLILLLCFVWVEPELPPIRSLPGLVGSQAEESARPCWAVRQSLRGPAGQRGRGHLWLPVISLPGHSA